MYNYISSVLSVYANKKLKVWINLWLFILVLSFYWHQNNKKDTNKVISSPSLEKLKLRQTAQKTKVLYTIYCKYIYLYSILWFLRLLRAVALVFWPTGFAVVGKMATVVLVSRPASVLSKISSEYRYNCRQSMCRCMLYRFI